MKKEEIGEIFGARLKQARTMSGLTLRGLSEEMGGAVSHNALNKYEKGEMFPSSTVLIQLSDALGRNQDFFFTPFFVEFGEISFRKRITKVSKHEENRICEESRDFFERYLAIERILEIDKPFKNPLGDSFVVDTPEKAERAAEKLRKAWQLGTAPLPNLHDLLERNGIKVHEVAAPDSFDGFSTYAGVKPLIVVAKRLDKHLTRKRHTLIHELGHLLFKVPDDISRKGEECLMERFAGAFMIPAGVMLERIGEKRKRVGLLEYKALKMAYGVSISALVIRANQLGIVSDSYTKSYFVLQKQGRLPENGEPGDYNAKGDESSYRFKGLVHRALAEGAISVSKASALLECPIHELRGSLEI